jgi:hypothetical protein
MKRLGLLGGNDPVRSTHLTYDTHTIGPGYVMGDGEQGVAEMSAESGPCAVTAVDLVHR